MNTRLATPLRSLDVDTLFHTRHITLQQGHQTPWYLIATMVSCVLVISLIIGYSLRFYIQRLFCDKSISKTPESNQAPQVSTRTHMSEYAVVDIKKDQPRESVAFASHSLHMSKYLKQTDEPRTAKQLQINLLQAEKARPHDPPLRRKSKGIRRCQQSTRNTEPVIVRVKNRVQIA